jgi:Protein of unknown function (DUF3110)
MIADADEFNMDELKRRIDDEVNPFHGVFAQAVHQQQQQPLQQHQPIVPRTTTTTTHDQQQILHIIAFENNAGVHSIEYPKGSGCNTVLAFENETACAEFASRLRAQQFFDPEVGSASDEKKE